MSLVRSRPRTATAVGLVVAAGMGLAACGSSSSSSSSTASSSAAPAASASSSSSQPATVELATVGGFGKVLVDGATGRTLYLLNSEKGDKVTCTAANGCTAIWPPLTLPAGTTKPTAGPGLDSADLGTVTNGGATQVTYNGWPLYTFSKDTSAGQATGEGINRFGGIWYVVDAAGNPVTSATSSASSASSSSSSSGGYY